MFKHAWDVARGKQKVPKLKRLPKPKPKPTPASKPKPVPAPKPKKLRSTRGNLDLDSSNPNWIRSIHSRPYNVPPASKANENAVGIITKQNTTKDVKPGETQRQAKKLGFKLDKKGRPPLLHKTAAKNSDPNTLFNIGLVN